jgi:hypothetical protein
VSVYTALRPMRPLVLSLEETDLGGDSEDYSTSSSKQSWHEATAEVTQQNKAARRSRRNHRQRVKKAQDVREERRRLDRARRLQIGDDNPDPLHLTSMTRPRGRFTKKNLLGTSIMVHGRLAIALLDSRCEAKFVVSRRFADLSGIRNAPIDREVGLPDGSRMVAARSDPIDLTVAGVTRQEEAVVVDLASFGCILGLPWLEDHNPVISWKKKKLLVPTPYGALDVNLDRDPCRSSVDSPSLLSTLQLQGMANKGDPVYVVALKAIEDEASQRPPEAPPTANRMGPADQGVCRCLPRGPPWTPTRPGGPAGDQPGTRCPDSLQAGLPTVPGRNG